MTLSVALLGSGLSALSGEVPAQAAFAATFAVDDVRMLVDTAPGDGVCSTGVTYAHTCTLYAAIQESNALNASAPETTVLITPAASIRTATGAMASTGAIMLHNGDAGVGPDGSTYAQNNPHDVGPMVTDMNSVAGGAGIGDSSTWFDIQGRITLDFQGRLTTYAVSSSKPAANAFLVNGPDATMRNFSNIGANQTAIYVGHKAVNTTIHNGTIQNSTGALLKRAVLIVGGAQTTTISQVAFGSVEEIQTGFIPNGSVRAQGVVIDRSDFNNDAYISGTATSANKPTGVGAFVGAVPVTDLSITNSTFRDFGWGLSADRGTAISTAFLVPDNMVIQGNVFSRRAGTIPGSLRNAQQIYADAPGTLTIRRNSFVWNSTTPPGDAAIWINYIGFGLSGTTIADNTFSGWTTDDAMGERVIQLGQTTSATISAYRNTMVNSAGATAVANENSDGDNPLYNASANDNMRTSYPGTLPVPPVIGPSCTADMVLMNPSTGSGGTASTSYPMQVDVFASPAGGDGKGMSQYLGRVQIDSALGWGLPYAVPYTGGPGVVRVQTMDAAGRSSQYSRTVALTGVDVCGPQTWIRQADGQADSTSVRNVTFAVQSSEPLGANGLAAADISFAGSTAPNPSVVSVTQTSSTTWTVVAKADGSGTIVPSIPSGSVDDLAGNSQSEASNTTTTPLNFATLGGDPHAGVPGASVDNSVTYISPLSVAPTTVTVTEAGATATYAVTTSKPATADITVTPTVRPDLATVTPSPLVMRSTDSSVTATVTALDNTVADGTRSGSIAHTVSSTDPEFDGLLLSAVGVSVNDNDTPVAVTSTLTTSPGVQPADGVAQHTATLSIRDAGDDPVANAQVYFAVGGSATGTGVATTNASGQATISITSTTIGSKSVTVYEGTDTSGTQIATGAVAFAAGAPDASQSALSVTTTPKLANGAEAQTATVIVKDAQGNPMPGAVVDFAVATGAALSAASAISDGDGTATVSVTSATPGSYDVHATLSGAEVTGSPAQAVFTTDAVDPSAESLHESTVVAAPASIPADGSTASTLTVVVKDASGNVLVGGGSTVVISTTAGTISSTTDHRDGTYTATLTGTSAATADITFTIGGSAADVTATVELTDATPPGAPVVDPSNGSIVTGVAEPGSTVTITDASGTPIGTGHAGPEGTFSIVPSPTPADGDEITVTATDDQGNTSPGTTIAIGAGPVWAVTASPANSSWSLSAGPVVADGIASFTGTFTARDVNDNLVGGAVFTVSAPGEVSTSAETCTTDATGVCAIEFTSTTPGTFAARAALGPTPVGSSQDLVFIVPVASASDSTLSVSTGRALANNNDAQTAMVIVRDALGNVVPGATVDFTVAAGATLSTASATSDVYGIATVTLVSATPGSYDVQATISGVAVAGSPESATFVAGSVDASVSTFTASSGNRIADGIDTHTLTATAKDSQGHPLPGVTIDFDTSSDSSLTASSAVTDINGIASTTVTSTTAGAYAVSAEVEGAPINGSPVPVHFVAGPPSAADSVFTVTAGAALADGLAEHHATVVVRDAFGNPAAGATVDFTVPSGVTASASSVASDATGHSQITLTSTAAGTYAIGASIGGETLTGGPKGVSFAAGAASAENSSWLVTPAGPVTADGTSAYTALGVARDGRDNRVEGAVISFTVPAGVDAPQPTCTTDAKGQCAVAFTSTVAGSYAASAAIAGDQVGASGNLVFLAGEASVSASTIDASPASIPADNTATSTITVTAKDANGNSLVRGGGNVVISTSAGEIGSTFDNGDGTYSATLRGARPATAHLTFAIGGDAAVATVAVGLTDATAPAAPVVDPSTGSAVTGTAEPGSIVTVAAADETMLGAGTAGPDGSFTIIPSAAPDGGDVVVVAATDPAGNASPGTSITIDAPAPAFAPEAPAITPILDSSPSAGARTSGGSRPLAPTGTNLIVLALPQSF